MIAVADFWKGIALGFAGGIAALTMIRQRAQEPIPVRSLYPRAMSGDVFSESALELGLRREAAESAGDPERIRARHSGLGF